MYIEKVPNRNSPPCILIRESFRDEGKVHKRTLANVSHLPDQIIEQIGQLLKGGRVIENPEDNFQIPLATLRQCQGGIIDSQANRA